MEKTMMVVLAAGIFVAAGCTQDQGTPVQQAAPAAESRMSQAVEQAAPVVAEAQSVAEGAAAAVAPEANAMVDQAQALLAQAKQLLDGGKLDEAIAVAQQVLSIDPQNLDAQNIIAMAQEKLSGMVQEQATEAKAGIMGQLNELNK